jgi:hypothetical protein
MEEVDQAAIKVYTDGWAMEASVGACGRHNHRQILDCEEADGSDDGEGQFISVQGDVRPSMTMLREITKATHL